MSINSMQVSVVTKNMVFKNSHHGKSKKDGRPFHIITLHDSVTLDNVDFFIREEQPVNTDGITFKDKVIASFGMDIVYGKMQTVLQTLIKA